MAENNPPLCVTENDNDLDRRDFLKIVGITTIGLPLAGFADFNAQGVSLIVDPKDEVANSITVQWAIKELETELKAKGVSVQQCTNVDQAITGNFCIAIAGARSTDNKLLNTAGKNKPIAPEGVGLIPAMHGMRPILIAAGHDDRGLIYALLELADRVNCSTSPIAAMHVSRAIVEHPLNKVRAINRMFCSEIEDKPWYNDIEMWPKYLTMLATQRLTGLI